MYLSVCSGIEAATCAWHPLGWRPFAFSEIEKFPSSVLAHHYPETPNLGDMTEFRSWPDADIDVLVGGTPCQSFSVAGLRKGLDDPRGNLMLTFGAIAAKYRPAWLVWENVPGVLSSNGGRDFGTFLGMLGQLGYGFAYRVLDAQYLGVAQRRRRVFVVGHLGDWRPAAAVLFERHSLSGHPAPRREAREVAPTIPSRSLGGGGLGTDFDCDGGLIESSFAIQGTLIGRGENSGPQGQGVDSSGAMFTLTKTDIHAVAHSLRGEGFDASEDGTGRGTPLVPVGVTIHGTDGCAQVASYDNTAQCLRSRTPGNIDNSSTTVVQQPVAFPAELSGTQCASTENLSPALSVKHTTAVAFAQNTRDEVRLINGDGAIAGALAAETGMKQQTYVSTAFVEVGATLKGGSGTRGYPDPSDGNGHNIVGNVMRVRRLTPRECERLQGFADNYTLIPVGKKMSADGPRYKALGNSMAVPVMAWIGERIKSYAELAP